MRTLVSIVGAQKASSAGVQFETGMLAACHYSRKIIMNKLIGTVAALVLLAGTASLAGCNTMEGAGKDVEATGEVIQKCADTTDPSCKR